MKKGERKQFCPHGHDTFVVGRGRKGQCNGCRKPVSLGVRPRKVTIRKKRGFSRFCPKGHDKDVVGRTKTGRCKECKRVYDLINKNNIRKYRRDWAKNNKEKIHRIQKKWRDSHKEQYNEYVQANKEKIREYKKKYRQDHKEELKADLHKRLAEDIQFRLAFQLRNRTRMAIKQGNKAGSAVKDLGCTIDFLKKYIEDKFYNGMTWNNWGTIWELDHIKALWKFDLTNPEQFKQAVHYTNLQPLTLEDHKKKTAEDVREYKKRDVIKIS